MDNIYDIYLKAIKEDIADKTLPASISRLEVYEALKNLGQLATFFNLANPSLSYPRRFPVVDAAFDLYVSKNNNVLGNVANTTNWKKLTGSGTDGSIYDLEADRVSSGVFQSTDASITAYATNTISIVTPNLPNDGNDTYEINSLGDLPVMKQVGSSYIPIASGDFVATSMFFYRVSFWLMVPLSFQEGGGGGSEITDVAFINRLVNTGSWANPYESIWIDTDPVPGNAGDYYILMQSGAAMYEYVLRETSDGKIPVRKKLSGD